MKRAVVILVCSAAFAAAVAVEGMAQSAPAGQAPQPMSLVAEVLAQFNSASQNITRSAEQFPDDKYTWTPPVPTQPDGATVRSWASLVAHMTDDANNNCWTLAGEAAAPARVEVPAPAPNSRSKADLVAGIKAALALCTKAFAAVTPANMMEPAGGRGNASKIGRLIGYVAHANEHYGNMVTYERLVGMVPPSSAGRAGGGARPGGAGGAMAPGGRQ